MSKNEAVVLETPYVQDKDSKYQEAPRQGNVLCLNSKSFHNIHYLDWGEETNPDTIFCIHGLTRNAHDFDALALKLAKNYRVICPDTVGRGKSDWLPNHEDYQIKQYNRDFATVTAKFPCEQYDIIGTSLGGMMGMVLAAMKNSPVRRLVINDIAPEVPHSAMSRLGSYLHLDPYFKNMDEVEAHLRKTLSPFNPMTDEDWRHLAMTSSRQSKKGYRLAFDPEISNTYSRRYWYLIYFNLWQYWIKIKCPVLILRGKDSDFLTDHLLDRMLRKLHHAEVVEFENTGHTPTLNAPEQIDPIVKWLNKTK